MSSPLKISLITVARNAVATLPQTLASVEAQRYEPVEYLVLDGGSTDGTVNLLKSHDPKIAYWHSRPDKGMYYALNEGIARATGDVIGLLNADDTFADDGVLEQVADVFADPAIDACYANLIYTNAAGETVRYWRSGPYHPGAFRRGWSPPHPSFYVRRSVYERLGGFDTRYELGNDIELMMRFLEKEGVTSRHVDRTWVNMRLGGISNRSWKNIWQQNHCVYQMLKHHNLQPNWATFACAKFWDRAKQFWRQPA